MSISNICNLDKLIRLPKLNILLPRTGKKDFLLEGNYMEPLKNHDKFVKGMVIFVPVDNKNGTLTLILNESSFESIRNTFNESSIEWYRLLYDLWLKKSQSLALLFFYLFIFTFYIKSDKINKVKF